MAEVISKHEENHHEDVQEDMSGVSLDTEVPNQMMVSMQEMYYTFQAQQQHIHMLEMEKHGLISALAQANWTLTQRLPQNGQSNGNLHKRLNEMRNENEKNVKRAVEAETLNTNLLKRVKDLEAINERNLNMESKLKTQHQQSNKDMKKKMDALNLELESCRMSMVEKDELLSNWKNESDEMNRRRELEMNELRKQKDEMLISLEKKNKQMKSFEMKIQRLEDENQQNLQGLETRKNAEMDSLRAQIKKLTQMQTETSQRVDGQVGNKLKTLEKELERYRANEKESKKIAREYQKLKDAFDEVETEYSIAKAHLRTLEESAQVVTNDLRVQLKKKDDDLKESEQILEQTKSLWISSKNKVDEMLEERQNMEMNFSLMIHKKETDLRRALFDVKALKDKIKLYDRVSTESVERLRNSIETNKETLQREIQLQKQVDELRETHLVL
jgi:hypothetical protein